MASVSAPCLPSSIASPSSSSSSFRKPRRSPSFLSSCNALPRLRHVRRLHPMICRCHADAPPPPPPDDGPGRRPRWDSLLHDAVRAAFQRWGDAVGSLWKAPSERSVENPPPPTDGPVELEADCDWDWERWKRHFVEVEEQERIVSLLKSQLHDAVHREDYKDAAKLKMVISAVTANDAVGNAIKHLNRAVEEEQYHNAAFIRDNAGTGLIGWWAGISEDSTDPYGRIIQITAEYGKYVARSYTPWQLDAGKTGFPLFEVYFTLGNDGKYKQQAVYLQRNNDKPQKRSDRSSKSMDDGNPDTEDPSTLEDRNVSPTEKVKDAGATDDDDSEFADDIAEIQNAFEDIIPGVKLRIGKIVGKVGGDLKSIVVEQILDGEEDEEKDMELETLDSDDDVKEIESEEFEINTEYGMAGSFDEPGDQSVNFMIGDVIQNSSLHMPSKDLVRVPARLDRKGCFSFSFSVAQDDSQLVLDGKERELSGKSSKHSTPRSEEMIISDIVEVLVSKQKVSLKILKDIEELRRLSKNHEQAQESLNGTMLFNRIEMPVSSDPLNGLYVSSRVMFSREIIYLRHKFGQWHEDCRNKKSTNLEFYEYVEAHKVTGDSFVPAGQIIFRAKIGKHYQLPHKGIFPEDLGVVARYRGQGRLAESGFRNPKWVDGEFVILDGKYIREGPLLLFVYLSPNSPVPYLMFFNRLKLKNQ